MKKSLEEKLLEVKEHLLDREQPLDIAEVLGELEYMFEDDEEVTKILHGYINDYYQIQFYAGKFHEISLIVEAVK